MKRWSIGLVAGALALAAVGCGGSDPAAPRTMPAVRLSFAAVPAQIAASAPFSVIVRAVRDDASVDTDFSGSIALAKDSGPATLTGALTQPAVMGSATFDAVSFDAEGAHTLIASSGSLAPARSDTLAVSEPLPGPATQLAFVIVPDSVVEAAAFTVVVHAQRADRSVDLAYAGTVTIEIASGAGALSGAMTAPAVAGVATFGDVSISGAAAVAGATPRRDPTRTAVGDLVLRATSGDLTPGVSPTIAVVPPPPVVVRAGTFSGQNGYTSIGAVQVLRSAEGMETLETGSDFRVSGGAGSISLWLTDATGAARLNDSTQKLKLGTITVGFAGRYAFAVPGDASDSFSHVVTYCDGARVNFGNAALGAP